ncbi:MAG TPA: diaminopimelate epimerase [Actinomycetota bacterium]|nr:diaminopimelate epimerase [Actinomycetota bacterium]
MKFSKYQGTGNDFVMLTDLEDRVQLSADMVRGLCDRRFGIGGDGVIRIAPGDGVDTDFFMDYVNSDGSIGEMCGNGIRCLAVLVRDEGLTDKDTLRVGTRAGIKIVELLDGGKVRVDMGPPIFQPDEIPVKWTGDDALHAKIELDSTIIEASCLSMGNPHAVLFVDNEPGDPLPFGPAIENHPMFPNGTNVEFARVETPIRVRMRVWERGSGETMACGTGACAVAVATKLVRGGSDDITVSLPGGDLRIEWKGSLSEEAPVFLTGPAVRVFDGEVDVEELIGGRR